MRLKYRMDIKKVLAIWILNESMIKTSREREKINLDKKDPCNNYRIYQGLMDWKLDISRTTRLDIGWIH